MSHFNCFVITPTKPTDKELEEILQPWHEYECTGIKDKYVVEVDITDEVIDEFSQSKSVVITADGNVYDRFDKRFYTKEPETKGRIGSDEKEFELPEGAEIKEMNADEARVHGIGYKTLAECAEDNYGELIERDDKYFRLTNPNKKWDYWTIGGRWTGILMPHYDPSKDPLNQETHILCGGTGKRTDEIAQKNPELLEKCNGCEGTGVHTKWPSQWREVDGDQCQINQIPLITIRDQAERKALEKYDAVHKIVTGREIPIWGEILEEYRNKGKSIDEAREVYFNNQVIKDLNEAKVLRYFEKAEEFKIARNEYASMARAAAVCPFSYVHEGTWYERGEMGWWAMVSNEKDQKSWAEQFAGLIESLPSEYWITVIDCHI